MKNIFLEKMSYIIFIVYRYQYYRYHYRPIRKLSLSGFIGIGQYEKSFRSYTVMIRQLYAAQCFDHGDKANGYLIYHNFQDQTSTAHLLAQ